MTPDQYLNLVLMNHPPNANTLAARFILDPIITSWAGTHLNSIVQSGSTAKGTSVKGGSDLDVFVSIKATCPANLGVIYSTLGKALTTAGFSTRNQRVSVGITINGMNVDITPGQQQPGFYNTDHSIWKNRQSTWTKTNVDTHIKTVTASARISEIKLAKIWRNCHGFDFPSFYLELVVIEALTNFWDSSLAARYIRILDYVANRFQSARFVDPANSANIISEDLTIAEKATVANRAAQSLRDLQADWRQVLW